MIHWRSREAHLSWQSADAIKLNFRFRFPRRCARSQGSGDQTTKVFAIYFVETDKLAGGGAAEIQTETIPKMGPMPEEDCFALRPDTATLALDRSPAMH
jgi:hypothetical protein